MKTVLKIVITVCIAVFIAILIRYGYEAFIDDFNDNLIDAKS